MNSQPSPSHLEPEPATSPPENGEQPAAQVKPAGVEGIRFPIVGVGASAGGLEALEAFFENLPARTGMAFVVVQHLSPDFKSMMDELLARHTSIPIHRVSDGMEVEPDAIYLIPPKKEMAITGGRLHLTDKNPEHALHLPIDIFFRSLAHEVGPRAIAIVLSGTGSDGSRGSLAVHEAGGFVLAQDPESAKFDGMPRSVIETGVVDVILTPEQMPQALLTYMHHPDSAELAFHLPEATDLPQGYDAIFQLLRKTYDIDFSYYKRTTVSRRIQRRLVMNRITDLDDYVDQLRGDAGELNLLYKDLLIGVTKFFRDAEAFARLEKDVLPQLFARVRPEDELRVWVAGCATGEEAYSLAILLREQQRKMAHPPAVRVFATDVHRTSLNVASLGIYTPESLAEVSPERLESCFIPVNGGYQVNQELRQMIVFAPHNLIKDAPFTKIDLVSCRNMLIYLEPPAQQKAISLFHFALATGGVMFLGPSESPGELGDEFAAIDERWRIFRKRRDRRLSAEIRLPLQTGYTPAVGGPRRAAAPFQALAPNQSLLRAYDEILKEYAPPALLVNDHRELVQSFSGAAEFLKIRDGRATNDVLDLVHSDLRIPLGSALQQADLKGTAVLLAGLRVHLPSETVLVHLGVKPLPGPKGESAHFLVTLAKSKAPALAPGDGEALDLNDASKEQFRTLELELRYSQESLHSAIEEMETSNEELQATNEELVASNEELQSTNEELHSVNEELYTVNAEYQKKIVELTEMTADLDNLLQSTDVGVVFLDEKLCIRKFTPRISSMFHLLPLDIGRRIDNFAHNVGEIDLLAEARKVLETGTPFETDVADADDKMHLLRILPYQSKTDASGVVLTLIDVSRLRQAEDDLRLMSKVFHEGAEPIVIEDLNGRIMDLNTEAEEVYGWKREELVGQSVDVLIPEQERDKARALRAECRAHGRVRNIETVKASRAGELIPVLLSLSMLTDQDGEAVAITTIAQDITERKRAEDLQRDAVEKRDRFLAMLSHELRNPLSAVLNATYVLDAEKQHLTPPLASACNIIQRQARQVARLLDDLLDVSRVTQGKIDIRREAVDLTGLISDTVAAVQPLMESRQHEFQVDITSEPLFVEGDPSRLLQVQQNLLTNAAKYTPPGGRIRLSVQPEDGQAVIRVRDNGRGIPSDMLDSIFELFVQSDATLDRSDGGMGLGLTLVRTLVSMHGGTVSAFSGGSDKGSEFVVRLPIVAAPAKLAPPVERKRDGMPGSLTHIRHIVVVEDNDDSREMLKALLELDGYRVTPARNGKQGLELILRHRPDVAIIDIGLPGMSGYEVAQQVRAQPHAAELHLIALTGYGRSEDCKAALDAGFNTHLVKPLRPEELGKILATLC